MAPSAPPPLPTRPIPASPEEQQAKLLAATERLVTDPGLTNRDLDGIPIFVIRHSEDLELLSGVRLKYMVVRQGEGPGVLRVCQIMGGHSAMLHSWENEPIVGAGYLLYDSTLKKMNVNGVSLSYPTSAGGVTVGPESLAVLTALGCATVAKRSGLDVVIEEIGRILGPAVEIIR